MLCLCIFTQECVFVHTVHLCGPGGLTKADRELIVVATSSYNQCLYCVVSHSALHRIYSKNPTLADQVVYNYLCNMTQACVTAMLCIIVSCLSKAVYNVHCSHHSRILSPTCLSEAISSASQLVIGIHY